MSYMYVLSSVLEKETFFQYILSKETIVRYLGGIWDGRGEAGGGGQGWDGDRQLQRLVSQVEVDGNIQRFPDFF